MLGVHPALGRLFTAEEDTQTPAASAVLGYGTWARRYGKDPNVLGRRIVKEPKGRIWAFLAGLAILRALALVPILGFLVGLAAAIFGLGLIGAAIGAARESKREGSSAWRQTPDT